jgi:hypothetical protein
MAGPGGSSFLHGLLSEDWPVELRDTGCQRGSGRICHLSGTGKVVADRHCRYAQRVSNLPCGLTAMATLPYIAASRTQSQALAFAAQAPAGLSAPVAEVPSRTVTKAPYPEASWADQRRQVE